MDKTNNDIDLFWQLLKDQCCVNPETAIRIVILSKDDFKKAAKKYFECSDKNNIIIAQQ